MTIQALLIRLPKVVDDQADSHCHSSPVTGSVQVGAAGFDAVSLPTHAPHPASCGAAAGDMLHKHTLRLVAPMAGSRVA